MFFKVVAGISFAFEDVFGLSWTFAGETGCDCDKSFMRDLPCMADAPERLERMKLLPLSKVPPTERIYPLEIFPDSDLDDPETPAESLLCGVACRAWTRFHSERG